jgi:transcriptional regulator with XRE-family HTH domain
MAKDLSRAYSRYAKEAITLLGKSIKEGRISRKYTAVDLADRAGISRALLYRIEQGDPTCSIGAVFESASIVGVPLFEEDRANLSERLKRSTEKLALMPKAVRQPRKAVKDAF